jgi:hypothetical protein
LKNVDRPGEPSKAICSSAESFHLSAMAKNVSNSAGILDCPTPNWVAGISAGIFASDPKIDLFLLLVPL